MKGDSRVWSNWRYQCNPGYRENNIKDKIQTTLELIKQDSLHGNPASTIYQTTDGEEKSMKQSWNLGYIDITNAYYTISRQGLWKVMDKMGVDTTLIKTVEILYHNNIVTVTVEHKHTNKFRTAKVVQGCSISPTSFKLYLEYTLTYWKRKCEGMAP